MSGNCLAVMPVVWLPLKSSPDIEFTAATSGAIDELPVSVTVSLELIASPELIVVSVSVIAPPECILERRQSSERFAGERVILSF